MASDPFYLAATTPPQGVYVHVPFCLRRCRYCDFNSNVYRPADARPFVDAVLAELAFWSAGLDLSRVRTVFLGGGTPTVLAGDELARMIDGLLARLRGPVLEFTVEANPATIDAALARRLAGLGVDRLSLGAQSFHDDELALLGRLHTAEQIGQSVRAARDGGLDNINLDLVYGLPGQSPARWRGSVAAAIALQVEHVSCYALCYEPGTELKSWADAGRVRPAGDQAVVRMYRAAQSELASAGFEHYEISNWSRPRRQCRHNLLYWRNRPWLGLGPGAASFLGGLRFRGVADLAGYVAAASAGRPAFEGVERLTGLAAAGEAIMLALRLRQGLDADEFAAAHGIDLARKFAGAIARHVQSGMLRWQGRRLQLTDAALPVADSVIADFIAPPDPEGGS